jgi:dolichol-phosphate mannosyltransferase
VLVFDSASTDNTQDIVKSLQSSNDHLHLKTEAQKSGLGSAYMQAMRYALTDMAADIVFEFDADLSHGPEYIGPMLEKIKSCDVVVGSRYIKGGSIPADWGWHRKLLSALGNYVARAVLTPVYHDFTSGFRATRKKALEQALPKQFLSNHYAYKLELLWLLHQHKASICEYPIAFIDREKGVSKLPANSVFDSLRVVLTLRYFTLKRYLKMCLVGFSGMAMQFLVYNIARQYLQPFHAAQLAVTMAIVNNFILNSRFTFKHRQRSSGYHQVKSLALFLVYSISVVYMQSYWLDLGVRLFGPGHIKENLIIVTGMIMGSFLNYFIYSRLVWRERKLVNS